LTCLRPTARAAPSARAWSLLLFFAASCGGPPELAVVWTPNPNPRAPLALVGQLTCDRPVCARVVLDDGERLATLERWQEPASERELLVLGLRPATSYAVTVEVEDGAGRTAASTPWTWTTPPLPAGFPPVHVNVCRPAKMEPGVTLIPAERWPGRGEPDRDFGALFALDERGDVVWFFEAPHAISEAKRMRSGNLLYYAGTRGHLVELDMLGNVVRQWVTTRLPGTVVPEGGIPVDASTIHHEVLELPSGNFLALSTELRRFESYPSSEDDPSAPRAPARVVGDVILEIRPDGAVVERISVLDLLDPYRIGYESLDWGFWQSVYENVPEEPLRDWAHVNSLDYDARERALIVSSYHQDAVFKLDLATRKLVWILGFPTGWGDAWMPYVLTPVGEGLYPFHQHSARLTPERTLLLFDNGKYRALPFAPKMPPEQCFSRAVEFAIDEERLEFRELWSYGGRPGEQFFTPFLGETDWLPQTGHVLVTDGGRVTRPDGQPGFHPAQGKKWARVVEVTRTTPAEVVFEVVLDEPGRGWTVYRSERLASLYPR
jgi:arylsulfate sulfotransferase